MERNAEPPKRTLAESATGLLMEAQRRLDESRRGPLLAEGGAPDAVQVRGEPRRLELPLRAISPRARH